MQIKGERTWWVPHNSGIDVWSLAILDSTALKCFQFLRPFTNLQNPSDCCKLSIGCSFNHGNATPDHFLFNLRVEDDICLEVFERSGLRISVEVSFVFNWLFVGTPRKKELSFVLVLILHICGFIHMQIMLTLKFWVSGLEGLVLWGPFGWTVEELGTRRSGYFQECVSWHLLCSSAGLFVIKGTALCNIWVGIIMTQLSLSLSLNWSTNSSS